MTQEEKAKRYDDVVSKLGRFMTQGVDPLITRADVQDFFPELKESEDEKIRKEIIDYIKIGTYKKDWIAWLEKQKHEEVAIEGQVRDHNFIDFDSSGTSFMIPVPNHNLKCGDKVLVKILKIE